MNGSIGKTLSEASGVLQAADIAEPRKEAVSLLMHTLDADRAFIIAHPERELTADEVLKFRQAVARRVSREPLQYITGVQEFFGLEFEVTPDVLIPRPETELIVEAALDHLKSDGSSFLADVGVGSGCIAISLLREMQSARAVGIDVSPGAVAVARRNAQRHCVAERLALAQGDGLSAFQERPIFSAIVSNPPYIPAKDIDSLQPEVREYEPLSALLGGEDGLSHIRVLVQDAAQFVQTNGYLIFEIGFTQSEAVQALIAREIWDLIALKNDLQNIPRVLVLRRK